MCEPLSIAKVIFKRLITLPLYNDYFSTKSFAYISVKFLSPRVTHKYNFSIKTSLTVCHIT